MVSHEKQIRLWWAKQVNQRPIWSVGDLPAAGYKQLLITEQLAYEVRRDIIVLSKPDTNISELVRCYFWEIASCILKAYQPYAIGGIAAINYYLNERNIPRQIDIINQRSSLKIVLHEVSELVIEKKPDFFATTDPKLTYKRIEIAPHYPLVFETPEQILTRLLPRLLKEYPVSISAFLKSVPIDLDILKQLMQQTSRPIIFTRLALLLENVGKDKEASYIRSILKRDAGFSSPGIIETYFPASLTAHGRLSDQPAITRFRDQIRYYAEQISSAPEIISLNPKKWRMERLIKYANEQKKYDAYHSSTIEGYKVTEAEIQALIDGKLSALTGATPQEIETNMALKGYLEAHNYTLGQIRKDYNRNPALNETLIKEVFAHLFFPSVEAGLVSVTEIKRYRNHSVFIRHSRYVPPNHEIVADLMNCLAEEINQITSPIAKAVLLHFGFVTIHPYRDGNGRTARLLMNYMLNIHGRPWITIRIDDRDIYFQTLETAQCDGDIRPFARFILKYLQA